MNRIAVLRLACIGALLTPLVGGELAFRQHEGGHTAGPDWPIFLDYASRYSSDHRNER